jgi:hypothetical protein
MDFVATLHIGLGWMESKKSKLSKLSKSFQKCIRYSTLLFPTLSYATQLYATQLYATLLYATQRSHYTLPV